MDVQKFVLDYNVVGIAFGTIIGFGLTNWVKVFRESILLPVFVKRFNLEENYGSMVSATIEVVVLVALIYLMYQYIIKPAVKGALEDKEKQSIEEKEWKNGITNDVRQIKSRLTNINDSNININDNIEDMNKNVKKQIENENRITGVKTNPSNIL